ncbi:MAG: signal peptidase II [Bdellovibrionales bacterium]|nr:signal peptidase II [Bdellovibrionales bacterium]
MLKRYIWPALILVSCIVLDQLSKSWAHGLSTLHFNQGFIMGIYADLPDSLRIVAVGAFAGFIFFLYLLLIYLIPYSARWVKFGLSFLVGGIFGNVIDKILYGRTLDFIPFKVGTFNSVFNLADVFQWIGCLIVLFIIFKRDKLLWFPDSSRQNYLINPREQFRVALNFSIVAFSTSIMMGIFSFAFFKTLMVSVDFQSRNLVVSYFLTYFILTLLFCAMSFIIGLIISHRSSGPLYAFEQYLDNLMKGRDKKLTLRDSDNYKHLEKVADKLRVHFIPEDE